MPADHENPQNYSFRWDCPKCGKPHFNIPNAWKGTMKPETHCGNCRPAYEEQERAFSDYEKQMMGSGY